MNYFVHRAMNLKNRIAHFMKAEDFYFIHFSMNEIIYTVNPVLFNFRVKLAVFYEQTLYLTAFKENVSEIYMQLPRRDIRWKYTRVLQ